VKACETTKCSWMQREESDVEVCETAEGGWMQVEVDVLIKIQARIWT